MEAQKKQAEALQLNQLIQLLYNTELVTRPENEEVPIYHQQFPIESIICPLCNEVMKDPVAIVCGHSFERQAIQEHFKRGEKKCPTCREELPSLDLTPNFNLRSSIEEWKQREMDLKFQAAVVEINSNDHSRQNKALEDMQSLMEMPRYAAKTDEEFIPKLEAIVQAGAIRHTVKQIYKGETEAEALAVLLELSKRESLGEKIGKTKDCIPILVSLLHNDDSNVSENAHSVLQNLSSNTHFAVKMAEAGYYQPFVACFNQGSPETRSLMAAALMNMQLEENSIAVLKERPFIHNIIQLLSSNSPASKSACLKCINKFIPHPRMLNRLLSDPVTIPLLLGLISFVRSDPQLKQQAAEILALMVGACQHPQFQLFQGLQELQSEHNISLFLQLVASSEPQVKIQFLHLLVELSYKSEKARDLIQSNDDTIPNLFSSLDGDQPIVRRWALKLLHRISEGHPNGVQLPPSPGKETAINSLATILTSSLDIEERSTASGIISRLPKDDDVVDEVLRKSEVLKAIHEVICSMDGEHFGIRIPASQDECLLENALAALLHFTEPSKPELQRQVGKLQLYPSLIRVLSSGSSMAKQRAATALAQLSQSTSLSVSNATRIATETNTSMPMLFLMKLLPDMSLCCSDSSEHPSLCSVHGAACSPRETFCLVKADAVKPLLKILSDIESGVAEAALMALETLLIDHSTLSPATAVIVDSQGVTAILQVLEKGSLSAKTKALDLFQKILKHTKLTDPLFKKSERILIQLLDDVSLKKKVGLVLRQMDIIPDQSSYF
ncbi:hypothetical protein Patl1_05645 [Pistacia atlantica]|uniref:Uncharacterized protein n=1 Tax=Pistacia atlantica TaxID=434234 RepID=A0ACC1BRG5_9ROSI|nr:hypothetical protein Patl1_05645 [Pistacia atlantica]